jgi:predicted DCC family thiol-disulfide oxidoreductase YuxK
MSTLRKFNSAFLNYVRTPSRDSPVNLAVARVILGTYLAWRVLSYNWAIVDDWPVRFVREFAFLEPPAAGVVLPIEKALLILCLGAFVVGYRVRLAATLGALLLGHLAVVLRGLNSSGHSTALFLGVYGLVFFALYRDADAISVDRFRETRSWSLSSLNDFLKDGTADRYRMQPLALVLVTVGIVYFGSGWDKVVNTPLTTWLTPDYLARHLLALDVMYRTPKPVADLLLQSPLLIQAAAVGTLLLELGFVVVILARLPITPFVVGLVGMHSVIALAMGPFFFGQYVLFALFVPWDTLLARATSDDRLALIYDEHCKFCARTLHLFALLDVTDSITFYSQSDVPDRYRERDDVDLETAMYAATEDGLKRGYHAFRVLLGHFGVFAPLVWFMNRAPVAALGERVYQYVARNRSRYFVCSVETSD